MAIGPPLPHPRGGCPSARRLMPTRPSDEPIHRPRSGAPLPQGRCRGLRMRSDRRLHQPVAVLAGGLHVLVAHDLHHRDRAAPFEPLHTVGRRHRAVRRPRTRRRGGRRLPHVTGCRVLPHTATFVACPRIRNTCNGGADEDRWGILARPRQPVRVRTPSRTKGGAQRRRGGTAACGLPLPRRRAWRYLAGRRRWSSAVRGCRAGPGTRANG